jgi:hypothetical protein
MTHHEALKRLVQATVKATLDCNPIDPPEQIANNILLALRPYLTRTPATQPPAAPIDPVHQDIMRGMEEVQSRFRPTGQPDAMPLVNDADLRRRIKAAIRSYGISHQDKADVESRADGVMIILNEYVLPFLAKPEREVVDLEAAVLSIGKAYEGMGFDPPEPDKVLWHKGITREIAKACAEAWGLQWRKS